MEIAANHDPSFFKKRIPDDDPDLNGFHQEKDPTGAEPECFDQSPCLAAQRNPARRRPDSRPRRQLTDKKLGNLKKTATKKELGNEG